MPTTESESDARLLLLAALCCCCGADPASAGWVKAWEEQASKATTDLGAADTNALFASGPGIMRYDIKDVPFAYFRKIPTSNVLVDPHSIFTDCWTTAHHGVLNKDFQLFGTEADLWAGTQPWQWCNYDDCAPGKEVGAFRDCGPKVQAHQKFHNLPTGSDQGQPDTTFYVYESTWGSSLLTFAALMGGGYVGGGVLYGRRVRGGGSAGGSDWLAAHPHRMKWVEVYGLCADGAAFARARGGGKAPQRRREPLLSGGTSPQRPSK